MALNGFTPKTAKHLQLDAGILVKNHTIGSEIVEANKLGATSGGSTFSAVPTIRSIFEDLDGSRGNYKDGNVIDSWDITLSATVKEVTAENIKLALGSADAKAGTETEVKYDVVTPRNGIKTTDYLDNLCWIGTVNGSDEFMIIELKNVLNTNGFSFTATDKGTGAVALELKAHFDLSKPDEVPFKIYVPKEA